MPAETCEAAAADENRQPNPIAVTRGTVSSILILQNRTFGDMVMTMALIDNLARHYPGALISILAPARYAAMFRLRPSVEFIPYHRRLPGDRSPFRALRGWGAAFHLLTRRPDILLDITDSRTGATLSALSRAPVRVGFKPKRPGPRRAHTAIADASQPDMHFLDRYLSPLKALGLPVLVREPNLRASAATRDRVMRALGEDGLAAGCYVAMHVGARVPSRQWPPERFAAIVDALQERHGLRGVLVGGGEDRPLADAVATRCHTKPLDRIAALSPEELVALLTNSRFFLGNESGPMHLAAASGAPVIALFGIQPAHLWGPSGEGNIVVQASMPCPCPFPEVCHPPDPHDTLCVSRITVDDVLAAAATVIQRSS